MGRCFAILCKGTLSKAIKRDGKFAGMCSVNTSPLELHPFLKNDSLQAVSCPSARKWVCPLNPFLWGCLPGLWGSSKILLSPSIEGNCRAHHRVCSTRAEFHWIMSRVSLHTLPISTVALEFQNWWQYHPNPWVLFGACSYVLNLPPFFCVGIGMETRPHECQWSALPLNQNPSFSSILSLYNTSAHAYSLQYLNEISLLPSSLYLVFMAKRFKILLALLDVPIFT